YLTNIATQMKIDDLEIHTELNGKYVTLRMESKKAALLIGKRGQTLNALQQLSQLVVNKFSNQFLLVQLDVENYRERRQESLELLAERMADKAIRSGTKVEFEPMPSYERKVIHNALSRRLDIETVSIGTEPNRYLVIEPLK
ncbi:MAG: RNA-binding cell elongation regulator Jag/EloR, partial [Planococcaceae bacterium]|nr:RNA-binding cell elongation regulator Jag/EloR [Planococcaceae bacterium]